jgi:hypothetical protein
MVSLSSGTLGKKSAKTWKPPVFPIIEPSSTSASATTSKESSPVFFLSETLFGVWVRCIGVTAVRFTTPQSMVPLSLRLG